MAQGGRRGKRQAEDMCSNRFRPGSHRYSVFSQPQKIFFSSSCIGPKSKFSLIIETQRAAQISLDLTRNKTWQLKYKYQADFQVRRDRPGVGEWKRVGDITKKEIPHRGNVRDSLDLQFQDTYYKISLQVNFVCCAFVCYVHLLHVFFICLCFFICLLCRFPIPGYLLQNSLALNMMILIMLKRFPSLGWIYPISLFWYYFNIYLNQTLSELGVPVLNTIM